MFLYCSIRTASKQNLRNTNCRGQHFFVHLWAVNATCSLSLCTCALPNAAHLALSSTCPTTTAPHLKLSGITGSLSSRSRAAMFINNSHNCLNGEAMALSCQHCATPEPAGLQQTQPAPWWAAVSQLQLPFPSPRPPAVCSALNLP